MTLCVNILGIFEDATASLLPFSPFRTCETHVLRYVSSVVYAAGLEGACFFGGAHLWEPVFFVYEIFILTVSAKL